MVQPALRQATAGTDGGCRLQRGGSELRSRATFCRQAAIFSEAGGTGATKTGRPLLRRL